MQPAEIAQRKPGTTRIVTLAQLQEGYVAQYGMLMERKGYQVLRDLEDGTYAVIEPSVYKGRS